MTILHIRKFIILADGRGETSNATNIKAYIPICGGIKVNYSIQMTQLERCLSWIGEILTHTRNRAYVMREKILEKTKFPKPLCKIPSLRRWYENLTYGMEESVKFESLSPVLTLV